jgi:hypothetical protein
MSVASLLAGWWLRQGVQLPAQTRLSGGSFSNGGPVMVELLVDGLWTDITPKVMVRDNGGKIDISRGQSSEGGQTDPGTCRFQLNNRDGLFSDRNPNSPYWGKIGRNTQLRVSVPKGFDKSYRFWGEVVGWPQSWDLTGTDVWVEIEAKGILRRLGQGESPLQSAMYRGLTSATATDPPVAYWPLEDASGSTTMASAIGGPSMSILGTPTLASFDGFHCSGPLPVMGDALFTGAVPAYPVTGQTQVRWLMAVPAAGETNLVSVINILGTGSVKLWGLVYGTGGSLTLKGLAADGSTLVTAGPISFAVNGRLLRVSIEFTQNGANIDWAMSVLEVNGTAGGSSGTFVGQTVGRITSVIPSPSRGMPDTAMGHVSVQDTVTAFSDLQSQLNAYSGETVTTRLFRLCQEQGVDYVSFPKTVTTLMGPQLRATFTDLMRECVTADLGILMEREVAFGLAFKPREYLYNQDATLGLAYTNFELSEVPKPAPDDQNTRNDITISRPFGSSARNTLDDGKLSIQAPPLGVGKYDTAYPINVSTDNVLPYQAAWRVHMGTADEPRIPQLSVNLAHPAFAGNGVLRNAALNVLFGARITVAGMPSWTGPDDVSQLVIGINETITHFMHQISFVGVPESPYRVATADDLILGRVDTDGSTLAEDMTPTQSTVLVATPGYVWTVDPLEFPFDLYTDGEVMTCTGISGATTPQTFTVTRSVNGVVKTHPSGSDVRLAHPAIVAL